MIMYEAEINQAKSSKLQQLHKATSTTEGESFDSCFDYCCG